MDHYVNPICGGQDPYILRAPDGMYYHVYSTSYGLTVSQSSRLSEPGVPHTVYTMPTVGWNCGAPWAPELHYLQNKYYIYYAVAPVRSGSFSAWATLRMGVLESDTPLGPYRDMGSLQLDDEMSIDGTVLESNGKLYFVYMRNARFGDSLNCLYIAPMSSPTKISGPPHFLCRPELPWEEFVNEGPEAIRHNGKLMIVFSAHAAHTPNYCLALLTCENEDDILNAASWTKSHSPIFEQGNGVLGPGHACMTVAPDGETPCLVYHCKSNTDSNFGYRSMWRMVCVQTFSWKEDGTPDFGKPLPLGVPMPLLPGEVEDRHGTLLENAIQPDQSCLIPYNPSNYLEFDRECVYLDGEDSRTSEYGCSAIIRDLYWENTRINVDIRMPQGDGAGVILRAQGIGARKGMMQGYVARLSPRFGLQLLVVDSHGQRMLGHTPVPFRTWEWVHLQIILNDDRITLQAGNVTLTCQHDGYQRGRIGLIAENCLACFKNMRVEEKQ